MGSFTDKELKKYEKEIRYKPLPVLYRERKAVKNDPTPERQNIVKARIEALEDRERRIRNAREREEEKRRFDNPFDKTGLIGFLLLIAATFAYCIIMLLFGSGHGGRSLIDEIVRNPSLIANLKLRWLLSFAKYLPAIGIFTWYSSYIPFFRVYFWILLACLGVGSGHEVFFYLGACAEDSHSKRQDGHYSFHWAIVYVFRFDYLRPLRAGKRYL